VRHRLGVESPSAIEQNLPRSPALRGVHSCRHGNLNSGSAAHPDLRGSMSVRALYSRYPRRAPGRHPSMMHTIGRSRERPRWVVGQQGCIWSVRETLDRLCLRSSDSEGLVVYSVVTAQPDW